MSRRRRFPPRTRARQLRLRHEVALARGDTGRAAEMLRGISGRRTPRARDTCARAVRKPARSWRPSRAWSRASGCSATPTTGLQNQRMIVDGIRAAFSAARDARTPAGADPVVAGWLELGRIIADTQAGALGAQRRLQDWRDRNPEHPASDALWRGVARAAGCLGRKAAADRAAAAAVRARRQAAGTAVRDGFLERLLRRRQRIAAKAEASMTLLRTTRPRAYLQALTDGSDYVVGPLTREEVAALATARGRPRDDARAQFPAGRRAGSGAHLPVRAVARRRSPARGAAHHRRRPDERRDARAAVRLGATRAGRIRRRIRRGRRAGRGPGATTRPRPRISTRSCGGCCARPASAAARRAPTRSSCSSRRSRCTGA